MSTHVDAIDTLNEVHTQTQAMLSMLMAYLKSANEGGEELADHVLANYAWQLKANMDRAEQATEEMARAIQEPQQ